MQIAVKFREKRKFFKIFVNFKENLIKILIGLGILKRFRVNYNEFPENYSGNFKLILGNFQRIKKS